jgi:hypothetical protein
MYKDVHGLSRVCIERRNNMIMEINAVLVDNPTAKYSPGTSVTLYTQPFSGDTEVLNSVLTKLFKDQVRFEIKAVHPVVTVEIGKMVI